MRTNELNYYLQKDQTYCAGRETTQDPKRKTTEIPFDVDLKVIKQLYNKAVERKANVFKYKGQDILTAYAKYLIQFLEERTT